MFSFKVNHLLFLFVFHGYNCQRRIRDGEAVSGEKKYVVYLVKASISPRFYDGWLCGGALVTPEFIVTSAACVTDVAHLYAIAGYNKYISDTEIYNDPCTKEKKKKIVQTCTHKSYVLTYEQPQIWSDIDIAVVKVESPYDFEDTSYAALCSYTPAAIAINYDMKYQEPGTDAMVLGWGHLTNYREEMDLNNYNMEKLYYSPVLIEDKEECKREYLVYEGMGEVIDKYMICTNLEGNINDEGITIVKSQPTAQGCLSPAQKLRGDIICDGAVPEDDIVLVENSRKSLNPTKFTSNAEQNSTYRNKELKHHVLDSSVRQNSSLINEMNKTVLNINRYNTRRNGICQNDHGGPLVTWVGSHEVLIGVASAFKISESLECIGPYLFTSTQCNGVFLDCILRSGPATNRRAICSEVLDAKGFKLIEKNISWKDHPDGPADNEKNITNYSKEEKKEKSHFYNNTESVNTNITETNFNTTHNTENSNLTGTTKDVNQSNTIIPMYLTNTTSANVKESAPVILTSETLTNLTNAIRDTATKYQRNASLINIEGVTPSDLLTNTTTNPINTTASTNDNLDTTTTILIKNVVNTTTLTKATITNINDTTTTILIKNATKNVVNATTPVNASLINIENTTTTNLMRNSTTNLINTTAKHL